MAAQRQQRQAARSTSVFFMGGRQCVFVVLEMTLPCTMFFGDLASYEIAQTFVPNAPIFICSVELSS